MDRDGQKNDDDTLSFRQIIQDSYVHGLKELFSDHLSWLLKVIWFLFLAINLTFMTTQISQIVKGYSEEITVTKITQTMTNLSKLKRQSICFTLAENYLYQPGGYAGPLQSRQPLSSGDLQLLGYVKATIPLIGRTGLWLMQDPLRNISWMEFDSIPSVRTPWMDVENASIHSQKVLYEALQNWDLRPLKPSFDLGIKDLRPLNFTHSKSMFSDILRGNSQDGWSTNSVICLPVELQTWKDMSISNEVIWFGFAYFAQLLDNETSLRNSFHFYSTHFNSKLYLSDIGVTDATLEEYNHFTYDYSQYLLIPTKHKHLNLRRRNCHEPGDEIIARGYGSSICSLKCIWKLHAGLFNCTFWEDQESLNQTNVRACHVYDILDQVRSQMSVKCQNYTPESWWCNNETLRSTAEWSSVIVDTYRESLILPLMKDCRRQCAGFVFCEEWDFEYRVQYSELLEQRKDTIDPWTNWSGLLLGRAYTLPRYVSVDEEVLKLSTSDFIASLGGILGFYVGFSICGVLQLIFFLFINSGRHVLKVGRGNVNTVYSVQVRKPGKPEPNTVRLNFHRTERNPNPTLRQEAEPEPNPSPAFGQEVAPETKISFGGGTRKR